MRRRAKPGRRRKSALDGGSALIRIPPETDVPLTPRVRRLIDTAAFARLRGISQLGLVGLVYPAAHHTRFEHSLGVYRTALLYLRRLGNDRDFRKCIPRRKAELLIVAALLHDVGHWPYCHAIEDMKLPGVPKHEALAELYLNESEVRTCLEEDWDLLPEDVLHLLIGERLDGSDRLLSEILSGPIDIDKMDYLDRDSLHAGVPYGRHFDRQRLMSSLCVNQTGDGLAITPKGRTAAELMVFARYIMFSEVYWHHAVRAATAMLQHAFYWLHGSADLTRVFRYGEQEMIAWFRRQAADGPAAAVVEGLFARIADCTNARSSSRPKGEAPPIAC